MRTIIITGGSSGLGLASACALAKNHDNHLILASRKPGNAAEIVQQASGNPHVEAVRLDLGSLDNVRQFVRDIKQRALPPLYAIVCNAGITLATGTRYSADGHELTFAVNHLGHFLLVNELLPLLTRPGRIINVSSGTHIPDHRLARRMQTPVPRYTNARALALGDEAPEADRLSNNPLRYTTSKLCNVLFTYELAQRLNDDSIGVFAVDPGLMPDTQLAREFPAFARAALRHVIGFFGRLTPNIRSSNVSGEHLRLLVEDASLQGKTALYFDGNRETKSSPISYERDKALDLWETSVELVGL